MSANEVVKAQKKMSVLDTFDHMQLKYSKDPSQQLKELCFLVLDGSPQHYSSAKFGSLGPNARVLQLLEKVSRGERAVRQTMDSMVRGASIWLVLLLCPAGARIFTL
jgi:hypothetical protein